MACPYFKKSKLKTLFFHDCRSNGFCVLWIYWKMILRIDCLDGMKVSVCSIFTHCLFSFRLISACTALEARWRHNPRIFFLQTCSLPQQDYPPSQQWLAFLVKEEICMGNSAFNVHISSPTWHYGGLKLVYEEGNIFCSAFWIKTSNLCFRLM